MAFHIRPITAADRSPIHDLLKATGAFEEGEIIVAIELVDAAIRRSDDYTIIVAEADGGPVVGYACYGRTPMCDGVYDLYWIAVSPGSQHCGIGRALLNTVERDVAASGGRMLLIETASKPSYAGTRAFYEGLGYKETARIPDFYKVGDDKIIYVKRFPPLPSRKQPGRLDAEAAGASPHEGPKSPAA